MYFNCVLLFVITVYYIGRSNNTSTNNIFIHTCYNYIEQYIPINNNIQRIIKHVMLNNYINTQLQHTCFYSKIYNDMSYKPYTTDDIYFLIVVN